MMGRSFLAVMVAFVAGGCGSGSTEPATFLPLTGQFSGTVATSGTATASFVAGDGGPANVGICGPAGVNFDLTVAGETSASASNCERVSFTAERGRRYEVDVTAAAGSGPFNGCWATALVTCSVEAPPSGGGGSGLAACEVAPLSAASNLPAGYYAPAEGKTGTALIAALNEIIDAHRVLGYTSARDSLYAIVADPNDDNVLVDVYTGRCAAGVDSRSDAAAAEFNTEHAWPQSRGANEDPANSDIHILFTADAEANGQRSNNPFGEVTGTVFWLSPDPSGTGEHSRLGRDASGRTVFEPRDSKKGDIARAIFYFHVRYESERTPSFTLANFNVEESTLLQWAAEDPVSQFERGRNDRIFRAQGNRNPFVDRPELVEAVGDFPN
ncbi:MAG: endonuclease I family protein [Gemmatimonadaceae bacterium]